MRVVRSGVVDDRASVTHGRALASLGAQTLAAALWMLVAPAHGVAEEPSHGTAEGPRASAPSRAGYDRGEVLRRVSALREEAAGTSIDPALAEQISLALARAERDERRGDSLAARRALAIADATIELARRRLAEGREQARLRDAQHRLARARERAGAARTAVEAALVERDRLETATSAEADPPPPANATPAAAPTATPAPSPEPTQAP